MLSQTAEYALRAIACLAYTPDKLMPTATLAEMTKVPSNYLAKVLQSLAQADLIVGRRGVGGGYRLARGPDKISMLEVVRAIDPLDRITTCPLGLSEHGTRLCPLHRRMDDAIADVIDKFADVTLLDLVSEPGANRPLCDSARASKVGLSIDGLPPS